MFWIIGCHVGGKIELTAFVHHTSGVPGKSATAKHPIPFSCSGGECSRPGDRKFLLCERHFFQGGGPGARLILQRNGEGNTGGPSWLHPPNYHKLAGPQLDSCHAKMMASIKARDPDEILAQKFGVTYSQDGWESVDHLPLINSVYMMANQGGVYLRSVDTSRQTKNAEYIAGLMISDIYTIGCLNVVLVVTDTCATMKKAWAYVLDEFPWMSAIPCVPHVISLLMKDIGQAPEVDSVIKQENLVTSWFTNHQKPLAILRNKVNNSISSGCELIKAAATRFGSNTYVGERLLKMKNFLEQTVVDSEYMKEGYTKICRQVWRCPIARRSVASTRVGRRKGLCWMKTKEAFGAW